MNHPEHPPLTGLEEDPVLASQLAALRLMEAELMALARLVPGLSGTQPVPETDEAVETLFDNLPV